MGVKWVSFQVDFKRHKREIKECYYLRQTMKTCFHQSLENLIEVAGVCMRLKLSLQSFMGSEISLKCFTVIQ